MAVQIFLSRLLRLSSTVKEGLEGLDWRKRRHGNMRAARADEGSQLKLRTYVGRTKKRHLFSLF